MPATLEICTWCERKYEVHQRKTQARGAFCSNKCRTAYHYDYERRTGWLMLELVRKMAGKRALPKFKAREYPGIERYRLSWNEAAATLRELVQ